MWEGLTIWHPMEKLFVLLVAIYCEALAIGANTSYNALIMKI